MITRSVSRRKLTASSTDLDFLSTVFYSHKSAGQNHHYNLARALDISLGIPSLAVLLRQWYAYACLVLV